MTYFRIRDLHYHRRGAFSLLSSGWDQVVPARYGRQKTDHLYVVISCCSCTGFSVLSYTDNILNFAMKSLKSILVFSSISLPNCNLTIKTTWVLYDQASRSISTGKLHALLHFHIQPINVVVFNEPTGALRPERSHLGAGFPLRCFQRLSFPCIATRLCHWHDNRNTRGTFTPVLSY